MLRDLTKEEHIEVQEALSVLVAESVDYSCRYVTTQVFTFGETYTTPNRRGEIVTRAPFALHLRCHWEVIGPGDFVLGSQHFPLRRKPCDDHAKSFYNLLYESKLSVRTVEVDRTGRIRISITEGYQLTADPRGLPQRRGSLWTLYTGTRVERISLSLTPTGLERVEFDRD